MGTQQSEQTPEQEAQKSAQAPPPPAKTEPQQTAMPAQQQAPSRGMAGGAQQELARGGYVSPFSWMRRMAEEMDSVFEQLGLPRAMSLLGRAEPRAWMPPVEVYTRDGEIVVDIDLPGIDADDVHVTVANDTLIIEGERRYVHEETGGVYRTERLYGSFRRTIALPEGIDPNEVTAKFDNGVLEIVLKLPQEQKPRAREVEVKTRAGAQKLAPPEKPATEKAGPPEKAAPSEKPASSEKAKAKGEPAAEKKA